MPAARRSAIETVECRGRSVHVTQPESNWLQPIDLLYKMNELQAVHTFWLTLTVQCSASHKRIDVVYKMFHLRTLTNKHSVGNGDWFHSTRIVMNCKIISGQHMAPHHLSNFGFFNSDGSKSDSDSLFARNPCSLNAASTSKDDLYLLTCYKESIGKANFSTKAVLSASKPDASGSI